MSAALISVDVVATVVASAVVHRAAAVLTLVGAVAGWAKFFHCSHFG